MDIGDGFTDENGTFFSAVFLPDNLHPLARGFEIWGERVSPTLAELFL